MPVKCPPPHIPCKLLPTESSPNNSKVAEKLSGTKSRPGAKNDKCIKCLPISSASLAYVLVSTPTPCSVEFPVIPLNHLLGPVE